MLARPLRRLLGRPRVVSYFHTTATSWASRKSIQSFKLADIGEGITECEVVKWSIKPQDTVQAFDPLCEVQSDKASVEITSPFDGVIKELLVQEGELAKVGSALCLIEVEEEETPPVAEHKKGDTKSETPSVKEVDAGVETPQAPRRLHPLDPKSPSPNQNVSAAPSVRHFARMNSVDLGLVTGSGKAGRIEKSDVEAFLAGSSAALPPTQDQETPTTSQHQHQDVVVELGRTRYGMWKAMTKSLEIPHFGYSTTLDLTALHSLLPTLNAHIPSHYLPPSARPQTKHQGFVNPSALYPAHPTPQIPDAEQYTRLTYLPFLLKTLSKAMLQWPLFRSSITPTPTPTNTTTTNNNDNNNTPHPTTQKPTLTIRPTADITIALSTPTGLYTPTLPSVNTHSIYTLASQLLHLSSLARQSQSQTPGGGGGLTPKEMPKRGGTITVSNVGAVGRGEWAAPVLVPGGGVAIVAIGRAKWVWDVEGNGNGSGSGRGNGNGNGRGREEGERRLKVGVSWSADHRVVEGAELAAFVECWRGWVEDPVRLVGEGV